MKCSFAFNGDAQIILTPENEDDYKLLEIALNGRRVREILKPVKDSEINDRVVIVLTREEKK